MSPMSFSARLSHMLAARTYIPVGKFPLCDQVVSGYSIFIGACNFLLHLSSTLFLKPPMELLIFLMGVVEI